MMHGEAGSVDINQPEIKETINQIIEEIKKYGMNNVYNMDETGLFYKCLPNRCYVKEENVKTARGTKLMKAKDRLTLYVCTNASGSDMVPLSVIGKSKNPRCFRIRSPKLPYYNQAKAWSDRRVFTLWFQYFLNYIRNRTSNKVLLLLDNCGPHGNELVDPNGQVSVMFLPPNTTSVYQPMDAGIIATLKKKYRYRLLEKMFEVYDDRISLREAAKVAKMQSGTMGLNEGYSPHIADAMDILYEVWKSISPEKVKNCWKKTTLIKFESHPNDDEVISETEAVSVTSLLSKFSELNLSTTLASGGNDNDFDDAIYEMAHAVEESEGDLNGMVEGWINMESTEFCSNMMADEVNALMEIDKLCNTMNKANAEPDDDEYDDTDGDLFPPKPITFELINALATQFQSLAVETESLGDKFRDIAQEAHEISVRLRTTYRKVDNEKSLKRKPSRQSSIVSFLN